MCSLPIALPVLLLPVLKRAFSACSAPFCANRQALAIDANNVKALFRRAQALVGLLDHELAQRDLAAAAKLDPANKDVRDLILKIKEDLKAQTKREKEVGQQA